MANLFIEYFVFYYAHRHQLKFDIVPSYDGCASHFFNMEESTCTCN